MIFKAFINYIQWNIVQRKDTPFSNWTLLFFVNIHSFWIRCLQHIPKMLEQGQQKTDKVYLFAFYIASQLLVWKTLYLAIIIDTVSVSIVADTKP